MHKAGTEECGHFLVTGQLLLQGQYSGPSVQPAVGCNALAASVVQVDPWWRGSARQPDGQCGRAARAGGTGHGRGGAGDGPGSQDDAAHGLEGRWAAWKPSSSPSSLPKVSPLPPTPPQGSGRGSHLPLPMSPSMACQCRHAHHGGSAANQCVSTHTNKRVMMCCSGPSAGSPLACLQALGWGATSRGSSPPSCTRRQTSAGASLSQGLTPGTQTPSLRMGTQSRSQRLVEFASLEVRLRIQGRSTGGSSKQEPFVPSKSNLLLKAGEPHLPPMPRRPPSMAATASAAAGQE